VTYIPLKKLHVTPLTEIRSLHKNYRGVFYGFTKHAFCFRKGKCEGELTHTFAAVSADVTPDGSYRGS
jgi:hypothetical protein